MLAYTVKNLIKNFNTFSKGNTYTVTFAGLTTKNKYVFKIEETGISLTVKDRNDVELLLTLVKDIDSLVLSDRILNPTYLEEIKWKNNGEIFERCEKVISYPAQLYITLFNLMHKKVSFTFRHEGGNIRALYLEGKTMFIEETENEYIVKGTDLNQLHHHFPNYEILHVSPCLIKFSYRVYMEEQEQIAGSLKKKFIKMRLDERVVR